MTSKTPSLSNTPLWSHQRLALDCIRDYLLKSKTQGDLGSALVHMPTGTGKTGVIACASHFLSTSGSTLILSPRVALKNQLTKELQGAFFDKLGLSWTLPKQVISIDESAMSTTGLDVGKSIFVSTIQMLLAIEKSHNNLYQVLKDNVEIVLVDEGHYEPAVSWREAIRGIDKPRVLFTATPFRNDLKLFDVNFGHAYSYTYHEAVKDKVIRSVNIQKRSMPSTAKQFVADVVQFYDTTFVPPSSDQPRVIIRCDSEDNIRSIGAEFEELNKPYVLIHENFRDDDQSRPNERRTVPTSDQENAIYWVHQFKLLEGIDDSRFRVVAVYGELNDTRKLIQQIGRAVRNQGPSDGKVAYFLDHSSGLHSTLWNEFLSFDLLLEKEGVKLADFGAKVLKAIQQTQPEVVYLDGRFRVPLVLDSVVPADDIDLPQTVNVLRSTTSFDLTKIADEIEADYERRDRAVQKYPIDKYTFVFLYLDFRNSPLLRSKCFIESRLGATVVRQVGDYVCVNDTLGGIPRSITQQCSQVSVAELKKLFPNNSDVSLSSVSLHNSYLGSRSIRSRSVSASRIDDTLPTFDDHSFVCTTVQGFTEFGGTQTRRYVGFGSGKVTDSTTNRVTFTDYIEWLDQIASVLASNVRSNRTFTRFADFALVPSDPTPTHILLDLFQVEDIFQLSGSNASTKKNLILTDASSEVANGEFTVEANHKKYQGRISFNAQKEKYEISSESLDSDFSSTDEVTGPSIIRYLNRTQSFRVIPKSPGVFYTLGQFYSPVLKFGSSYDDDQIGLLKVIEAFPELNTINSEKGSACASDGSGWEQNCLFALVDSLGSGYRMQGIFGSPDVVVCDDMGTEAADFILGYSNRVIFIHCKSVIGEPSLYSASNLQIVCAQATKNLRYFSRFGNEKPPKATNWHKNAWKTDDVSGEVKNRIRRGANGRTGTELWSDLKTIIRNPNTDLEVWILLSRTLSKSRLEVELRKSRPAAEAQQAAYLLFSTMNAISSVGARLKVLCSP